VALTCLQELRPIWQARGVSYLPYQVKAAERIVDEMGGHGILADEVGLGKTIEAGLVIRELMKRERCQRVLVLCPAGLIYQWQRELQEKFDLAFAASPHPLAMSRLPLMVVSLDQAKREPARSHLLAQPWDLVIVDEAHKLKNRTTQNHRLVAGLRRRHLLLLSATPMQNDLTELYGLVSLVDPQLFGSFQAFWRQFLLDRRTPKDPAALRAVLASIMIRHRRQDLEMTFPQRQVALLPVALRGQERELYDAVTAAVRDEYRRRMAGEATLLPLITMQREVCSSAAALGQTLDNVGQSWLGGELAHLRALCDTVSEQGKAVMLEGLLEQVHDHVLVYTEFRATQDYLRRRLLRLGVPVVLYAGDQSAYDRDRACRRFEQTPGAVMISTEAGGQGLNFQFCHHLVNYDLPWNPMRVEQRIGRIHRLGQHSDVFIYNLYAQGTVEEHILRLLDEKIHLFREVVGELDVILRRFEKGGRRSLEARIAEIVFTSRDPEEVAWRFDTLGRQIALTLRRAREGERLVALDGSVPAEVGKG
jgi:SNF2 family DNA or RNA helicase